MRDFIHISDAAEKVIRLADRRRPREVTMDSPVVGQLHGSIAKLDRDAHNQMLIARLQGVSALQGTPETDADPRNPNLPVERLTAEEYRNTEAERGLAMIEKGLRLLRDNSDDNFARAYLYETWLSIGGGT